ncbi:hypothetical protein BH24CHL3_BH24CHL3_03030 [soil metagenome]
MNATAIRIVSIVFGPASTVIIVLNLLTDRSCFLGDLADLGVLDARRRRDWADQVPSELVARHLVR